MICFECFWKYFELCFWMRREGIETFHRSPLRENSGSIQFVETDKRSSRSPRELKFVSTFQDRRSEKNSLNDELMWCLVVFQHDFHGQYPPQVKEKLFLNDILCLKRRSYLRSRPLARNHMKQILWCNNQANELQLSRRWNQETSSNRLSQMTTTWS